MTNTLQRVGNLNAATGTLQPQTAGITGAQRVQASHGEYADAALRGNVYYLPTGAITLAAANVTGSALGTIELVNGFANPPNSGYNAVILRAQVATVSGTPAGPFFYDYYAGVTVTATPTGTIRSALLNRNTAGDTAMIPLVDVAVTVSGGATTATQILGVLGGPAAVAAGAGLYGAIDEVRGAIVVPPGTVFGITCTAAGTTHIVRSTLVWEELPVIG